MARTERVRRAGGRRDAHRRATDCGSPRLLVSHRRDQSTARKWLPWDLLVGVQGHRLRGRNLHRFLLPLHAVGRKCAPDPAGCCRVRAGRSGGRMRLVPRWGASALLILLAGCDPGDVVLLAPETRGPVPTFSIRAVVDTPYAALAASLGWTAGVPSTHVRVHRMDEPYDESYWHSATADGTGVATFAGLLPGLYEVEVSRVLGAAETGQVDSAARLLAGGRRLTLPAAGLPQVTMEPDHRGSLVTSEWGTAWPSASLLDDPAAYFEVYNNSDTTIYLDGKLWGLGWDNNYDFSAWPCAPT